MRKQTQIAKAIKQLESIDENSSMAKAIGILKEMLFDERRDIQEAYSKGAEIGFYSSLNPNGKPAEQYFKETFTQKDV